MPTVDSKHLRLFVVQKVMMHLWGNSSKPQFGSKLFYNVTQVFCLLHRLNNNIKKEKHMRAIFFSSLKGSCYSAASYSLHWKALQRALHHVFFILRSPISTLYDVLCTLRAPSRAFHALSTTVALQRVLLLHVSRDTDQPKNGKWPAIRLLMIYRDDYRKPKCFHCLYQHSLYTLCLFKDCLVICQLKTEDKVQHTVVVSMMTNCCSWVAANML